MKNITFIGAGNMARAIINGLLANGYPQDKLFIANRSPAKLAEFPVQTSTDNEAMAQHADVIVLAVKPYQIATVCEQLKTVCQHNKPLIISVAVGTTIEQIQVSLGYEAAIIRSMPNTPSAIGFGATGLYANALATDDDKSTAADIFNAVGSVAWVEREELLSAVAAVSGSGPAYYFLFMQAMLSGAEKLGLDIEVAKSLITQTVIGTGKLASVNNHEFTQLRQQVTSPNGTTFAATEYMQQHGIVNIIEKAMLANVKRAEEIANEN